MDAVLLEKDGPVGRLILNRPEKHNALRFADLDRLEYVAIVSAAHSCCAAA